eukprot:COSAG02_NODE_33991_length_491_cov_0.793367_1_plen_51_part_10
MSPAMTPLQEEKLVNPPRNSNGAKPSTLVAALEPPPTQHHQPYRNVKLKRM